MDADKLADELMNNLQNAIIHETNKLVRDNKPASEFDLKLEDITVKNVQELEEQGVIIHKFQPSDSNEESPCLTPEELAAAKHEWLKFLTEVITEETDKMVSEGKPLPDDFELKMEDLTPLSQIDVEKLKEQGVIIQKLRPSKSEEEQMTSLKPKNPAAAKIVNVDWRNPFANAIIESTREITKNDVGLPLSEFTLDADDLDVIDGTEQGLLPKFKPPKKHGSEEL